MSRVECERSCWPPLGENRQLTDKISPRRGGKFMDVIGEIAFSRRINVFFKRLKSDAFTRNLFCEIAVL